MISPNDFPHKPLLTNRQVVHFRKAFANKLSTDIMLSKTQLAKLIQTGRALDRRISSLWKTSLPLTKNIIQLLAKSVLISLGSTAVASAADVGIHKNILGSGTTTQIISDDKMVDIMKIAKIENSVFLLKGVDETIRNEAKDERGVFLVCY